MRSRGAAGATALVIAVVAFASFGSANALADPPANEPCSKQRSYEWQGEWETKQVRIPSLANPDAINSYAAIARAPRNLIAYPNKRPVVFLQGGADSNKCLLSWIARDLAGHGYITVTWTTPKAKQGGSNFANAADSVRSAVSWARGPSNPYLPITDTGKTALGGFGLGANVVSLLQADAALGTDAVIALDNLVQFAIGDPGAGTGACNDATHGFEVAPAVPALGFARDAACKGGVPTPTQKLPGFLHWRQAKTPTMELAMAGFGHEDFGAGGNKGQHRLLSYYSEAWLKRWLFGRKPANDELLAKTVFGFPTQNLLSTGYLSGAYVPGVINTANFRDYIPRDHAAPKTTKTGGTDHGKKVDARKVRRTGIRFRFRANEQATFQCRLDNGSWNHCEPPKKIERRLGKGKHTFRVRATDVAGNREAKPAKWEFRIVK